MRSSVVACVGVRPLPTPKHGAPRRALNHALTSCLHEFTLRSIPPTTQSACLVPDRRSASGMGGARVLARASAESSDLSAAGDTLKSARFTLLALHRPTTAGGRQG